MITKTRPSFDAVHGVFDYKKKSGKNRILNSIVVVGFPDLLELIVFAAIFGRRVPIQKICK